jgi:hypothetical protein
MNEMPELKTKLLIGAFTGFLYFFYATVITTYYYSNGFQKLRHDDRGIHGGVLSVRRLAGSCRQPSEHTHGKLARQS